MESIPRNRLKIYWSTMPSPILILDSTVARNRRNRMFTSERLFSIIIIPTGSLTNLFWLLEIIMHKMNTLQGLIMILKNG